MFKKTSTVTQMDLFTSPETFLGKRASKTYSDPKGWHNVFFDLVTSKIDEDVFSVLYKSGNMGAPTASVRILVAMSILKEGFGCSDEDLFERVEFDLLVRKALGLVNLDDTPPSLDTYYLFNRRLCNYEEETGIDLMEKCFEGITQGQIKKFSISGKSVRMDSKLIGSNIARYSRYEIILRTFQKTMSHEVNMARLNPSLRKRVLPFMEEKGSHTVYTTNAATLWTRITHLGAVVYNVLKRLHEDAPGYPLLHRVFHEQYEVVGGAAILRDKKEIKSTSVQNPNDPDAEFRVKGDQNVKGYSTNLTETVEEGKPSLIVAVQVKGATAADSKYVEEAIAKAEQVTGQTVENLYADGAYQSPSNREFAESHLNEKGEPMKITSAKIQGGGRYILKPVEGSDNIAVVDTDTGEIHTGLPVKTNGKRGRGWKIESGGKCRYRYFWEKDLEGSLLRQELDKLPIEVQNKRNNVEAAMFQYSFHTRNNKTRYRGLLKHAFQATRRSAWINFRRLALYIGRLSPENARIFVRNLLQELNGSICGRNFQIVKFFKQFFDFFKSEIWGSKFTLQKPVFDRISIF